MEFYLRIPDMWLSHMQPPDTFRRPYNRRILLRPPLPILWPTLIPPSCFPRPWHLRSLNHSPWPWSTPPTPPEVSRCKRPYCSRSNRVNSMRRLLKRQLKHKLLIMPVNRIIIHICSYSSISTITITATSKRLTKAIVQRASQRQRGTCRIGSISTCESRIFLLVLKLQLRCDSGWQNYTHITYMKLVQKLSYY